MLSLSISDGVTDDIWFSVAIPVRNVATRSLRGKLVGAIDPLPPITPRTGARNPLSRYAG